MPSDSAAELLSAFGMTEADLELNAQGRLAQSQGRRLRRMAALNLAVTVLLAAGLGGLWLAVVEHPILWWQWLLVAILEAALLVLGARWVAKLVRAAATGEVVLHAGSVHAFVRRGKHLTVAGLTYSVPIPLNRLVQDAPYDVYVVEEAAMVVAMAPISRPGSEPMPGAPSRPSGG